MLVEVLTRRGLTLALRCETISAIVKAEVGQDHNATIFCTSYVEDEVYYVMEQYEDLVVTINGG